MVRKSFVIAATALSLVSASVQAAPARLASPIGESEALDDDDAWILPLTALLIVLLLVLTEDRKKAVITLPTRPVSP